MKTEKQDEQARYKAHHAFAAERPAFMGMALAVVNSWERGEATLTHAIGMALSEAWNMGRGGVMPEVPPEPTVGMVRRRRPAPAPLRGMVRRSR